MTDAGVLVDVDGTLVDSNYHHAIAWSRALRDHGQQARLAAIHRLIGMGADELLDALDIDGDVDDLAASWREHFDALLPEIVAFRGAADLLRAIHASGLMVVLATSSPPDLLVELRARIGADDAIDLAVTSEDVEKAKPAPDIFDAALRKASLDRTRVVAVGDSVWDVEAAAGAGISCIGVECGGFSRLELEAAGAAGVYAEPCDLTAHLDTSPIGHLISGDRP